MWDYRLIFTIILVPSLVALTEAGLMSSTKDKVKDKASKMSPSGLSSSSTDKFLNKMSPSSFSSSSKDKMMNKVSPSSLSSSTKHKAMNKVSPSTLSSTGSVPGAMMAAASPSFSSQKKNNPVPATPKTTPNPPAPPPPKVNPNLKPENVVGSPEWAKKHTVVFGNAVYAYKQSADYSNRQCEESIKLTWRLGNVEKEFKRKCTKGLQVYNGHYLALLMVGSPSSDLCIFSTEPLSFFYKDNNVWKKVIVETKTGPVREEDMTEEEIKQVTTRMNKWKSIFDPYVARVKKQDGERDNENMRNRNELNRIYDVMNQETIKYNQNILALKAQRNEMEMKYNLQFNKLNLKSAFQPWDESLQKEFNDKNAQLQNERNAMQTKFMDENNRYKQTIQDLENQINLENQKHLNLLGTNFEKYHQLNNDFKTKYDAMVQEDKTT